MHTLTYTHLQILVHERMVGMKELEYLHNVSSSECLDIPTAMVMKEGEQKTARQFVQGGHIGISQLIALRQVLEAGLWG